ncbi:MAG: hypothetical protein FJ312_10190 [SAR202 cluster bacterium]|nr:hypothetical protein [SAR202 cluster bacterium]
MWWFKQAVLHQTEPEVQLMHPWYLDYSKLDVSIRGLVYALNCTDLVETLCSCGGHPESRRWQEETGAAYVLYRVLHPCRWTEVVSRLERTSGSWDGVRFLTQGKREQWMAFQAKQGPADHVRQRLDTAISQTTILVSQYEAGEMNGVFQRHLDPGIADEKEFTLREGKSV